MSSSERKDKPKKDEIPRSEYEQGASGITGTPFFKPSTSSETLTTLDHYLALTAKLPPEKILSIDGQPVYCRVTNNYGTHEVKIEWNMKSVRSIEEGYIFVPIPSNDDSSQHHQKVEYGTGTGKDFKAFSGELASKWPEKFKEKLAEKKILDTKQSKNAISVDQTKLQDHTIKFCKEMNYYERLFNNVPKELKDRYEIKSANSNEDLIKLRTLVTDCIEAVFKDCDVVLMKIDIETGKSSFANTIEYCWTGPNKNITDEDRIATGKKINSALDRLGMAQVTSHRRYISRVGGITNVQVINNMDKFFKEALKLNIAPSQKLKM